jgi:hypothetical protein
VKLVGRREIFVRDRVQVLAESLQPRHDSRQKSARLVVTKHFLVRLAHGGKTCADVGEPSSKRLLPPRADALAVVELERGLDERLDLSG